MKHQILFLNFFKKQLKNQKKKFPNIKEDLLKSLRSFEKEKSVSLGSNNYKLRVKSSDIKRGSSKAFRLIIHFVETKDTILPFFIYFKGKKESASKKEINRKLAEALKEFKEKY